MYDFFGDCLRNSFCGPFDVLNQLADSPVSVKVSIPHVITGRIHVLNTFSLGLMVFFYFLARR